MAMLTDDEYKDFEAQIKLQEKVFEFFRTFYGLSIPNLIKKWSNFFDRQVSIFKTFEKQESGEQNNDSEKLKEKVDEDGTGTFYSNLQDLA